MLHSADEARKALADLDRALKSSDLREVTKVFLRDQIDTSLRQIANQMSETNRQVFRVARIFEGEDYKVSIKACPPSNGFVATLKRFLARV